MNNLQIQFVYSNEKYTSNSLVDAQNFVAILEMKGITDYQVLIYETVVIAMGRSLENAIEARELFYTKFVPMSEDDF